MSSSDVLLDVATRLKIVENVHMDASL